MCFVPEAPANLNTEDAIIGIGCKDILLNHQTVDVIAAESESTFSAGIAMKGCSN